MNKVSKVSKACKVSEGIIAWRTILEVLKEAGYYDMYEDEIGIVANEIKKANRMNKAIEKIESTNIYGLRSGKTLISTLLNDILNILKGE